jgi:hypothetical protein
MIKNSVILGVVVSGVVVLACFAIASGSSGVSKETAGPTPQTAERAVVREPVASQPAAATIETVHPGLACAALTFATLSRLPDGVLLESGTVRLNEGDLKAEVGRAPAGLRDQLAKNAFFLLEKMAAQRLILDVARRETASGARAASQPDGEVIKGHLQKVVQKVEVAEAEVKDFYENNKDACGGAKLDQIRDQVSQYVLQQKRQAAVKEYVRTLGQRLPIRVSAVWAERQAAAARDNPVDKARASGKPSVVDFGATGCRPCDMMAPILDTLKKKYEGKAHILFVHVRQEQILAERYGVESIPVQVFFDKNGKEVLRHVGFFPQPEIEKQLAKLGAM